MFCFLILMMKLIFFFCREWTLNTQEACSPRLEECPPYVLLAFS